MILNYATGTISIADAVGDGLHAEVWYLPKQLVSGHLLDVRYTLPELLAVNVQPAKGRLFSVGSRRNVAKYMREHLEDAVYVSPSVLLEKYNEMTGE